ncbi:hypothetical protein CDG60_08435 [Acinetobacter chinensis]|uniref:Uncharacterized protein n=1 Tax=Acinetobacter chinensis TaxID=2004650 RepID=A0A3B7LW02_9GAMM|nr:MULTISPECIES: DUF6776 family protein [Acinetobacter]AXY56591.1 hypothetical protein CDG60_08435 [Acinetobacter chinensis]AXY59977.1 hypothetical protein CDG61_08045 [Acinetobacter sp. WCHAc010052]MDV2468278.1 hypothetical protein [Acinetobacter chinensis]WOE43034.1 hypothetical protein QSG87_07945 [Acinetobacter chinensis]
MQNTDSNITSQQTEHKKQPFLSKNTPLAIGAAILVLGSGVLGYTVGHRQGLTVVGFDADAEQLVDVVQKQKASLEGLNKSLNTAVQERDVAVSNSNDLYKALNQAREDKAQNDSMSLTYREVLRQRGGLSLTVQNLGVKSLPENAYEYQVDLVQVSPGKRRASGSVEIRLIRGTEVLVVPLEDNQFNFEDYERLTGRWTMPKGFVPQFIEVRLTGATPVIKRFSWARGAAVEAPSAFIAEIPQAEANAQ